jgi:hypothetical protein
LDDGKPTGDGIADFYGWEQPPSPPELYSWDVPERHVGGITDDPAIAAGHVHDELVAAEPGTVGTIKRITPDPSRYFPERAMCWSARRRQDGTLAWKQGWSTLPAILMRRPARARS